MSLKSRLAKKQRERKAQWEIIELDYALSWVLAAIGEHFPSKETLVFKGGTCLKKCYFGELYRFSQDLDFTALPTILDKFLDDSVYEVAHIASTLSGQTEEGIEYTVEQYPEKEPHPFKQRAYLLRVRYPWHRTPLTKIKLEISRDEELMFPTQERGILHEYGEHFSQTLNTYSLEEILAEKFRGILQNQERFKVKGWVRSRVRDFYDLWHILKQFKTEINFEGFQQAFVQKCLQKGITFEGREQFFNQEDYLATVKKDWGQFLDGLITTLPSFEETVAELKVLTNEVFKD